MHSLTGCTSAYRGKEGHNIAAGEAGTDPAKLTDVSRKALRGTPHTLGNSSTAPQDNTVAMLKAVAVRLERSITCYTGVHGQPCTWGMACIPRCVVMYMHSQEDCTDTPVPT